MGTIELDRPSPGQIHQNALPAGKSRNPFFFRNNPHPSRVRHIKGLLDTPVCSVMDSWHNEDVPNLENKLLVETIRENVARKKKKETFVPGVGLVTVNPTWVEELKSLTKKVEHNETKQKSPNNSRNSSRQSSRNGSRLLNLREAEKEFVRNSCAKDADVKLEDAFSLKATTAKNEKEAEIQNVLADNEVNVARLLSQILNTDSLDVIKHWLTEAPEKEKEVVLDMLRKASNTNLEFREVVNRLNTVNNGDIKDGEKMPAIEDVSPRSSPRGKDNSNVLEVIKENIEADIKASRASSRQLVLPPITNEEKEIEDLRSQLASRSNINVFTPKTGSRCRVR